VEEGGREGGRDERREGGQGGEIHTHTRFPFRLALLLPPLSPFRPFLPSSLGIVSSYLQGLSELGRAVEAVPDLEGEREGGREGGMSGGTGRERAVRQGEGGRREGRREGGREGRRKEGREGGPCLGALAPDSDAECDNGESGPGVDQVGGGGGGAAGHHVHFLREGRRGGRGAGRAGRVSEESRHPGRHRPSYPETAACETIGREGGQGGREKKEGGREGGEEEHVPFRTCCAPGWRGGCTPSPRPCPRSAGPPQRPKPTSWKSGGGPGRWRTPGKTAPGKGGGGGWEEEIEGTVTSRICCMRWRGQLLPSLPLVPSFPLSLPSTSPSLPAYLSRAYVRRRRDVVELSQDGVLGRAVRHLQAHLEGGRAGEGGREGGREGGKEW